MKAVVTKLATTAAFGGAKSTDALEKVLRDLVAAMQAEQSRLLEIPKPRRIEIAMLFDAALDLTSLDFEKPMAAA